MTTSTLRRQFTVSDYARMRETGILTEDDRVELLDGEIYLMSPLGPLHIAIVNRLNKLLMRLVGDDAILSIQNSVQLNHYSEPQPDVALLSPRDDYYDQALARPDDILLLIELVRHRNFEGRVQGRASPSLENPPITTSVVDHYPSAQAR